MCRSILSFPKFFNSRFHIFHLFLERLIHRYFKLSYADIGRHIYKLITCIPNYAKKQYYSEKGKLSLLASYYHSSMSKHSFCVYQGLCGTSLLNKWIKKHDFLLKSLSLSSNHEALEMVNRSEEDYKEENAQHKCMSRNWRMRVVLLTER